MVSPVNLHIQVYDTKAARILRYNSTAAYTRNSGKCFLIRITKTKKPKTLKF